MPDTPTPPPSPLIKKVAIAPIQQRIAAVNEDRTLAMALHGDLNRIISSLSNVTNFNAETLQLVLDALAANGIIVTRLSAVEAAQAEQSLVNSYTNPTAVLSTVSASGAASITIINHQRVYTDAAKTTVNVTGGTISGLAFNTQYYIYYDDPTRAGGAVTYHYTTDNTVAAQTGARHALGGIQTGGSTSTTPSTGGGVSPPGSGHLPPRGTDIP